MRSVHTAMRAAALLLWAVLAMAGARAQEPAGEPPERAGRGELITTPLQVRWEGPDPLRDLLRKSLPPPDFPEGRRRGALRPWVRDVRRRGPEIAAAEGWFSATVDVQLDEGRENATVTVVPGPRTTVAEVDIDFKGDLARDDATRDALRSAIRESWTLPPGSPFRSADWESAKTRLQEKLTERDYAAGMLAASQARVDAEAARATLSLVLDSGPVFTLGDVKVVGLERYPEAIVRRVVVHEKGERFTAQRLQDLQRTLQNAPWFGSVVVQIERDREHSHEVPVIVTVVERPSIDVGLALGFSTDSGPRAEVSFRHRDLLDRGLDLQSSLRVEGDHQFGYADVFLPAGVWTLGGREVQFRDSVGVLAENEDVQGLHRRRLAMAGYRNFTLDAFDIRAGLSFQVERSSPQGAEEDVTRALAPVLAVTWRHVDDPFDPKRGGVLNAQFSAGGKSLGSTQDFVKLYAQYTRWITFTPTDQVVARGEIGRTFAPSRSGIPEDFLFRAGGARSNRGYAYQSLGVKQGDAIVGGRYLLTASVDYIHWIRPQWGAAVFLDVGDATDGASEWNGNRSYGVGARYKTPAGPLSLDLAYAERDRKFRLAFSVTVAF